MTVILRCDTCGFTDQFDDLFVCQCAVCEDHVCEDCAHEDELGREVCPKHGESE